MNARQTATAHELVPVPFHGEMLYAVRDGERVWISIRRVCEVLGIQEGRQLQKLNSKAWATVYMMYTVAEDGKTRESACLDLDTLPMWLSGIEPSKVKPVLRQKLIDYQKECAKVLRDYFFSGGAVNSNATPEQLEELLSRVNDLANDNARLVASVTVLNDNVLTLRRELDTNLGTIGNTGADQICSTLKRIAEIQFPDGGRPYRSALSKMHSDLRGLCNWASAKKFSWEFLPRSQAAKAKQTMALWLAVAEETRAKTVADRQQPLPFPTTPPDTEKGRSPSKGKKR